ncbi:MAG: DUF3124 domain-containing protein [Flavobacteriaceae bacterium]|nr:DUF3124 domain-containing protein [Flavobacteriaceae bacterium]
MKPFTLRTVLSLIFAAILCCSCEDSKVLNSTNPDKWKKRMLTSTLKDSMQIGSTFLSIYSQLHNRDENQLIGLFATVSLHNPNVNDSIFIDKTVYYNTDGKPIRTYFDKTIYIRPMETVQIIIEEQDNEGGTGANFVFDWKIKPNTIEPIFEAVMISTYGSQSISFITNGKRIK